jgi:hypothetical protein|tara:strand:+ start:293 stop:517 length:225 start_codon:yes stop_codon:yes gene_type:complete
LRKNSSSKALFNKKHRAGLPRRCSGISCLLGYLIAQLFSDIAIKAQTTATILNMLLSITPKESSAFLKIEYGFS